MNKKNWLLLILVCTVAITSFSSCKKDKDEETVDNGPTEWERSIVFKNDPRNGATSFTINKVAYVIGGFLKNEGVANDATSFDGKVWRDVDDFAGEARQLASGFAIDGVGYMGLGSDGNDDLNDFYKFEPSKPAGQQWTKIADFPGRARHGATAFAIGKYGYVGLGSTKTENKFSDFYRYDPATDKWDAVPAPFKYKKAFAFSFVIGDKAYVGGGFANSANLPEDFYSFDGKDWVPLPDLNRTVDGTTLDARKYNAATFVIGNQGYVVSGRSGTSITNSVWKFDPSNNTWTDKHQALPVDAREKAVGFAIDGKGYVTTGINGSFVFDSNLVFTPVR